MNNILQTTRPNDDKFISKIDDCDFIYARNQMKIQQLNFYYLRIE